MKITKRINIPGIEFTVYKNAFLSKGWVLNFGRDYYVTEAYVGLILLKYQAIMPTVIVGVRRPICLPCNIYKDDCQLLHYLNINVRPK